jgi:hypothetical protein
MVAGGVFGGIYFLNPGDLHVVCPEERYVGIYVVGEREDVLNPGDVECLGLERGEHVVRFVDLENGTRVEHDVDVGGGFYSKVAPVTADQCFVSFDVSEMISPGVRLAGDEKPRPRVQQRWNAREPFDKPGSTYLDVDMLPSSLEGGCCAYLGLGNIVEGVLDVGPCHGGGEQDDDERGHGAHASSLHLRRRPTGCRGSSSTASPSWSPCWSGPWRG